MKFEIPLFPGNQIMSITMGNAGYVLRFIYCQTLDEKACWLVDINGPEGLPIVCGVPLVPGEDLLVQYKYLGFDFALTCSSEGSDDVPSFASLGVTSHVQYQTQ